MKTIAFDNMPGNFTLYGWGDIHVGNIAMCEHVIKKFNRKVTSTKNGYAYFGGDQLEAIDVTDKRFSLDVHIGRGARIDAQRDCFIEDFKSLTDKTLWIMDGNHEGRWKNIITPNKDIAKALNTEYCNGVLVKAIFPTFRMLDWHGKGQVRSRAGDPLQRKVNTMVMAKRRLRHLPGGDCEIMSVHHYHQVINHPPNNELQLITNPKEKELLQIYTEPAKIWIDKDKGLYRIPEEDKWYVCCGSALRGYIENVTTYVEEMGLPATELGCIKITVKNDKIYKVEEVIL